jgi:vacuolar protein-sorting-associated protein 4
MEVDLTSSLVQQAVTLEQSGCYQDAITSYLKAIQVLTESLSSDRQLTKWKKLEIQYNIDTSIARSRFLLGVSSVSDHHELNTSTFSKTSKKSASEKPPLPPRSPAVAKTEDKSIKEQLLASVLIQCPNITWDSIVGLECAKQPIREAVLVPIMYLDSIQAKNAWKGILLFGVNNEVFIEIECS